MRQAAEDAPLPFEARLAVVKDGDVEKLDFRSSFDAHRQPDGTHAAFPQRREQSVGTDGLAREGCLICWGNRAVFEEMLVRQGAVLIQQGAQLIGQRWIFIAQ